MYTSTRCIASGKAPAAFEPPSKQSIDSACGGAGAQNHATAFSGAVTELGNSMFKLARIRMYCVYKSNGRNSSPRSHVAPKCDPDADLIILLAASVDATNNFINTSNTTTAVTYSAIRVACGMHLLHVNGLTVA
jgi:hypothetical protein